MQTPAPGGADANHTPRAFWFALAGGFASWVALLMFSSAWDLRLSLVVADASAAYGVLVARFGEWPAWLVVVGCLVVLLAGRKPGSRLRRYRPLAAAVILVALIEPLVVTQSLKFLWGRVRPRNLDPGLANFTPFYLPAGPGAGESFPSGHVAMAFSIAPLAFYADRYLGRSQALVVWLSVLAYGLAVAWGRILAGAHFLSDCVFSAGLTLLLAAIVCSRVLRARPGRPAP